MKELFEKWSKRDFSKMSKVICIKSSSAFKRISALHNAPYKNIKAYQMQKSLTTADMVIQPKVQSRIYLVKRPLQWNWMSSTNAIQHWFQQHQFHHQASSIHWRWNYSGVEYLWPRMGGFSSVLPLYRFQNRWNDNHWMCQCKPWRNDHQRWYQDKSRKRRIVPIHPKIQGFVRNRMSEGNKFLFSYKGKKRHPLTQYYIFWNQIMEQLSMSNTHFEYRHTFRSRLDSAGANKGVLICWWGIHQGCWWRFYQNCDELKDTINCTLNK